MALSRAPGARSSSGHCGGALVQPGLDRCAGDFSSVARASAGRLARRTGAVAAAVCRGSTDLRVQADQLSLGCSAFQLRDADRDGALGIGQREVGRAPGSWRMDRSTVCAAVTSLLARPWPRARRSGRRARLLGRGLGGGDVLVGDIVLAGLGRRRVVGGSADRTRLARSRAARPAPRPVRLASVSSSVREVGFRPSATASSASVSAASEARVPLLGRLRPHRERRAGGGSDPRAALAVAAGTCAPST